MIANFVSIVVGFVTLDALAMNIIVVGLVAFVAVASMFVDVVAMNILALVD
jgi:hypothetical protein